MNSVLGILEDDERCLHATFERAVELADRERALLTLAKTTDPGWLMRWFAPAAIPSMMVPETCLDFDRIAGNRLARAVEFVPAWIPVTTVVLPRNTSKGVLGLLRTGCYDGIVASSGLLGQCPRLRRGLIRAGVEIVAVRGAQVQIEDLEAGLVAS